MQFNGILSTIVFIFLSKCKTINTLEHSTKNIKIINYYTNIMLTHYTLIFRNFIKKA